jgi:DNA-binding winged helix-turn-helix (wHTH) protein
MRLTFGTCVLDRERRELTRGGSTIHTSPKLLALLELLLDARPRAIAKREIHEVLWPGTFVSDATLTSLVAELRTAIGDNARTPNLVRTLHGYGYAFIGEVVPSLRPSEIEADDGRVYRIILGEREIALSKGEYVLGRASDAFVFVDDVGVSRHHARIRISGGSVVIEDLGSKNGTVVNGQTIDVPTTLVDGSLIVLGATTLKFRIFEASNSTDTVTRGVGA